MSSLVRSTLLAAVLLITAPGVAAAAPTKPGVTTGAASNVVQTSARVAGTVDPNGVTTAYYFQYGTTAAYSAATPEAGLTGDGNKNISVDLAGLTAATKYHYRLVARNSAGTTLGADRTFTTKKTPLGITLGATPNPVPFGSGTVIGGQVTGTGNGGITVALQSNPFPYTDGFKQVGNPVVADAAGNFSVSLLAVPFNTQYRVVQAGKSLTSPIVTVGVASRVSTNVSSSRVRRGRSVIFSGFLKPALPGTLMVVQRKNSKGNWQLAGTMIARTGSATEARYTRKVRMLSTGSYRVFAGVADGRYLPSLGREVKITVVKR